MRMMWRAAASLMLVVMLASLMPVGAFAAQPVEDTVAQAQEAAQPAAEAESAAETELEAAAGYVRTPPYTPLGMNRELPKLYGSPVRRSPYNGGDTAAPLTTYYYKDDSSFYAVVADESNRAVFRYAYSLTDYSYENVATWEFPDDMTLWGGFYDSGAGQYLATGAAASGSATAITLTKLGADFTATASGTVKAGAIAASGTVTPFVNGGADMALSGGDLAVYTSAAVSDAGQGSYMVSFDASTLAGGTATKTYADTANQMVLAGGATLTHSYAKAKNGLYLGNETTPVLAFKSEAGAAFTGTTATGFGANGSTLVVGTSVPHGNALNGVTGASSGMIRNAYLITYTGGSAKHRWLTSYSPYTSGVKVSEPSLTPYNSGFLVTYTVVDGGVATGHVHVLDGDGAETGHHMFPQVAFHASSRPLVVGGELVWVGGLTLDHDYGKEGGKEFYLYRLDLTTMTMVEEVRPLQNFALSADALSLTVGDAENGEASLSVSGLAPSNASVSDSTIGWTVTPAAGLTLSATTGKSITLTAAKAGSYTVACKIGGITRSCAVTVEENAAGLSIIDKTIPVLYLGGTGTTLKATVTPAAASQNVVEWTSSEPNVATVNAATGEVAPGTVTGTAIITAAVRGTGFEDTVEVQVRRQVTGLSLTRYEETLAVGGTLTLPTPDKAPSDGEWTSAGVTWRITTGEGVVSAPSDSGGGVYQVEGLTAGTAKLTATATKPLGGTVTTVLTINVSGQRVEPSGLALNIAASQGNPLKLALGDAPTVLTATLEDGNGPITDTTVKWSSSVPGVARVNPDGTVVPLSAGSTIITAASAMNESIKKECHVTVLEHMVRPSASTVVLNDSDDFTLWPLAITDAAGLKLDETEWTASAEADGDGFQWVSLEKATGGAPGAWKVTASATPTDIDNITLTATVPTTGGDEVEAIVRVVLTTKDIPAQREVSIADAPGNLYTGGQTLRLSADVAYRNAEDAPNGVEDGLVWSVEAGGEDILEIDENTGVVTTKDAAGTATVKAALRSDGSIFATLPLKVDAAPATMALSSNSTTMSPGGDPRNLSATFKNGIGGFATAPPMVVYEITGGTATAQLDGNKISASTAGTVKVSGAGYYPGMADPIRPAAALVLTSASKALLVEHNEAPVFLYVGETYTPAANAFRKIPADADGTLKYKVQSGAGVISVDEDTGEVTALAAGNATLRCYVEYTGGAIGKHADLAVTVSQKITGLRFTNSTLSLKVGGASALALTPAPIAAKAPANLKYEVVYETAPGVLSLVGSSAASMQVQGKKKGSGVVRMTASHDGASFESEMMVEVGVETTGLVLNRSLVELQKTDGAFTLTATLLPSNAASGSVTWKTSASTVAGVDSKGLVTPKGNGYATITACVTENGKTYTAECLVIVNRITTGVSAKEEQVSLAPGNKAELGLVLNPSGAPVSATNVYYEVENESPAGVVSLAGNIVTANNFGNATIRMTFYNESGETFTAYTRVVVSSGTVPVESVTAGEDITLAVKDSALVPYAVLPEHATNQAVTITAEPAGIVSVSGASVTGLAPGQATLTITTRDGGKTATLKATVLAVSAGFSGITVQPTAESAASDPAKYGIPVGRRSTFKVVPNTGATLPLSASYQWRIENESGEVLKADSAADGTSYTVTANALGNAKLHVAMSYDGQIYTASSTDILVGGAVEGITLNYDGGEAGGTDANGTRYTIAEGETLKLKAALTSTGGDVLDERVIWTCVGTEGHVQLTHNGLEAQLKGLAASQEGYAVSARTRDGGFVAEFTVYVGAKLSGLSLDPLTVSTGATRPVPTTFSPDTAANKTLKWESLDESVFTVDENTGEVTGVFAWDGGDGPKTAQAKVKATWVDKSAKTTISADATVTVVPALKKAEFAERDYVLGYVKNALQELPEVKFDPAAGRDVLVLPGSEEWTSGNTKVLLVTKDEDGGTKLVTKAKGTAALTYTFADGSGAQHTLTCTVRVTDAQALKASSVKLSKSSATLVAGKEKALTLKFSYSPASVSFRDVVWISSDENVATVDQNGVVTTHKPGPATITATARYLISSPAMEPETASCVLNVVCYAEGVTITSYSGTPLNQLEAWSSGALRMVPDEYKDGALGTERNISALAVVAVRNPIDTTDAVRWTTSNAKVVAIEGSDSKPWDDKTAGQATLTAKKTGSATITAYWGKKKASFKVNVVVPVTKGEGVAFTVNAGEPATLALNASKTFKPAFVENANGVLPTNRKVVWSAQRLDDPLADASKIISLNANTGTVKGLAPGSVKLTATSLDDARAFASVTVNVVAPVTALRFNQSAFTMGTTDGARALSLTFNNGGAVSEDLSEVTLTIPKDAAFEFVSNGTLANNADGSTSIRVSAAAPSFSITPQNPLPGGKDSLATTITAKTRVKDAGHPYAQKSATLKVTVKKTPPDLILMNSVDLANTAPAALAIGKSHTPKLKILPSNAVNKNMNWSISAAVPGVGGADPDWREYVRFEPATGKVTALAQSTSAYNGRYDVVFTVTGKPAETDPAAAPENVAPVSYTFTTAKLATKVQVRVGGAAATTATMRVGDELTLSTLMTPADASSALAAWKLGGTAGVAELSLVDGVEGGAASVRLKALKAGKVTLTATAADGSKKSAKITVTVQQQVEDVVITNAPAEGAMMAKGASHTFKAEVNYGYHAAASTSLTPFEKWPAATVKTVRWEAMEYGPDYPFDKTERPKGSVVSVNAKTGKVTALADGYALIRAVAVGDESVVIDGVAGGAQVLGEDGTPLTLASTYLLRVNVTPTAIKFGTPGYTQGNFTMYRSDDAEEEVTLTLHAQTIPELSLLTSFYDEDVGITESRSDELTWSIPLLPSHSEDDEVYTDGRLSFEFTDEQAAVALARHRKSDTEGYQTFRALSGDDTMTFKVAAVAPGETYEHKITVSADNDVSATLTVKVVGDEAQVIGVTGVSINKTATWLTVGKSETLKATLTPSVPKKKPSNGYVNWKILNQWAYDKNGVAQPVESGVITLDAKGKVTAKKAGYVDVVAIAMDGEQSTEVCRVYCVARS